MKRLLNFTVCLLVIIPSFSQVKETYDIISYLAPKQAKKDTKTNVISYTLINQTKRNWCQIAVYKSMTSKGSVAQDFQNDWQELIVSPNQVKDTPQIIDVPEADGWTVRNGGASYTFNQQPAIAMLTTITGYGVTVSIVSKTNSQDYLEEIQNFISSVVLKKPENKPSITPQNPTQPAQNNTGKFAFTTTNFDDGWTSTVQENWVQCSKGNIKVLIHYPNTKADAYNSVLKDGDYNAWNVLVSTRYSNMKNFEWKSIQSWQSISFMQADATENASGKTVHIVLFKEHYSNGSGAYLEFVTDNKAAYEAAFGPYHNTEFDWEKTANMQFRNKFAVAATDFKGTWTNDFTGIQQYVNVYTGANAGMSSYSSNQVFTFSSNNKYNWQITVASGMAGNIKFQNVKSSGTFSFVSNWQVKFSDMEGKPKTYDAYFSCIRGGRILWLSDIGYPGYTAFGKKE